MDERESVFSFIKNEEKNFQNKGVPIVDGWDFHMYNHIRLTTLYKYGQLDSGKTDDKPVENIILPILRVASRLEDINVKDIQPYVDDRENHFKSFLVKKFHDRWARENDIDTLIDRIKDSWIDFGLGVVKNKGKSPEHVPLQSLAFCDQTDILSGPICQKHQFSVSQLLEMKGRWDDDAIDHAIVQAKKEKSQQQVKAQKQSTPGKYIEVYELHGSFPEEWNPKADNPDPEKYTSQIHVITYYKDESGREQGIPLYQGAEREDRFDVVKRDEVYGRACGYGGAEELFEQQVWHTYSRIQLKEMLDVAADMIVATNDENLAKRQKLTDRKKGELLEVEDGKNVWQVPIQPINWDVFDKWREDMRMSAQTTGSAQDPQLGAEPKSGTAWGLQRLVVKQGQQIHQYRKGLFATFLSRLYRKRFIKYMRDEINKGDTWLEELSLDEMKWLAEEVSRNDKERQKKKMILEGKSPSEAEMEEYKEMLKDKWLGSDNKKFIKTLKNEIENLPMDVKIDIDDKQKDLGAESEKIVSFMRAIVSNPEMLTVPGMDDLLNQVIEYSGLDPVDFSRIGQSIQERQAAQQQQQQQAAQAPQQLQVPGQQQAPAR